jgi:hypothetical protein
VVTPTAGDPSGKLTSSALELGLTGEDVPPLLPMPGVAAVNPTSLFPSVSPGSGSGSGSGSHPPLAGSRRSRFGTVTTGAVALMDSLIGGQVIDLAVLVGALAIVFVRVSPLVPVPSGGPGQPQRWSVRGLARHPPGWARWHLWARRT